MIGSDTLTHVLKNLYITGVLRQEKLSGSPAVVMLISVSPLLLSGSQKPASVEEFFVSGRNQPKAGGASLCVSPFSTLASHHRAGCKLLL